MELDQLGWNDHFAAALTALGEPGLVPARVVLEYQGIYRIDGPDGEGLADLAGRLRHAARGRDELPAVGDWVAVAPPARAGDRAVVRAVLPRLSKLSRKVAGDREEEQILAANVDHVFVVAGCDRQFNPRRLERFLAAAWEGGAQPVLILTKADLPDDPESYRREAEASAPGVPVHLTSAVAGSGLDGLAAYLRPGRTIALLGVSGAGKSTLTNALAGTAIQATREVRDADDKGRHTTTHRELFALPSGALVIDTPGMRELQFWSAGEGTEAAFEDVLEVAAGCRFRDCAHESEPGCAVRAAVESGALAAERVASFRKLRREAAATARRENPQARTAYRQKFKTINRALRRQRADEDTE